MNPGTQTHAVLGVLLAGQRITPIDALSRFGCFRLGARIYDLRQEGYQIERDMIEVSEDTRIAAYWMTQEARAEARKRGAV